MTSFSPDREQSSVLDHDVGPLLVVGGSGTGKTAVLRERFLHLVDRGDPERVALVVGSRRARDEAIRDLLTRVGGSQPVLHVVTLEGLANAVVAARYAALDYAQPPRILSADEQFARVRELLGDQDPADWPAYGHLLGVRAFADEVRQFLKRAQEARRTPEAIEAAALERGLTGWQELARFARSYLDGIAAEDVVDFASLVEQAGRAAEIGAPLFDHLLMDDYQDSTIVGEFLLRALRPASLIVAADPEGHVFSFQGTTDVPLRRFAETFPGSRSVRLSTRHRGAQVSVRAWSAPHGSEQYAGVARELRRIHVEDGMPWRDLAVIVRRQGSRVTGLLRALDDARVPRIATDAARSLATEPGAAPYVTALRWLTRPHRRDALVEPLLTSDLVGLSPATARAMVRAARTKDLPRAEALEQNEGLTPEENASIVSLRQALARAQPLADRSVLDTFEVLWKFLPSSASLVRRAAEDPSADRELEGVLALSEAVARASQRDDPSTTAFLASLDSGEDGPGGPATDRGADAVRVLTAHGSVGREFDTVIVVDAMEGDFPSLSRPEPMFDLDVLDHPQTRSEVTRRRLEDERRLFDVVVGRAGRGVLFTASEGERDDRAGAHSRFVDEIATWSPLPVGPFDDPLTVAEADATWRRALGNPAAADWSRLAALAGLVALGSDPSTWWYQNDWTDTGHPLHETIRASASRLDTLENCELQFVLGQELGLDVRSGFHAWVGSLVHKIIEDVENGELPRDLEATRAAARQRWRPAEFPTAATSDAFLQLVLERMLPQWWDEFGGAPARATERRFEFPFAFEDGYAVLRGFIDRIGPCEGGSQIVDYKTGKFKGGDADDNLQLGVYYLAVQDAEELAEFRPVKNVELVFVRDLRYGRIARVGKPITPSEAADYEERTRERVADLLSTAKQLNDTGVYAPNPLANCRFCRFTALCPLYPEGRDAVPAGKTPRSDG